MGVGSKGFTAAKSTVGPEPPNVALATPSQRKIAQAIERRHCVTQNGFSPLGMMEQAVCAGRSRLPINGSAPNTAVFRALVELDPTRQTRLRSWQIRFSTNR